MAVDPRLGWLILALLAGNSAYYVIAGRASEALESLAWYVLLILFMLESSRQHQRRGTTALALMRGARWIATVAIAASGVMFVREQEWLDATNAALWIAVVVMLEIELRHPARLAVHHRLFTGLAASLYGALAALVLIWLVRGEWMDGWDAALWLAAFGILELGLLNTTNTF